MPPFGSWKSFEVVPLLDYDNGLPSGGGAPNGSEGGAGSPPPAGTPEPVAQPTPTPSDPPSSQPGAGPAEPAPSPLPAGAVPPAQPGGGDQLPPQQPQGLTDALPQIPGMPQFQSDQEALQWMAQRAQAAHELEQNMNWLRSQQNNPSADPEYQAWLKEKKRQEEQAKADERAQKLEKLKPQLPEWNPEWENLLQYDAQGNLVAVPGADPTLPQKYKQYRRARDTAIDNMLRDPYANTLEFIRDDIEQIVQQRVDQALGATTEQQKAEQILQQNSQWLFEYDQSGQPVHDPMTGKPKYSALGRMYSQVAAQYYGSGMSIEQANEHAIRYVESEIARHKYMQDQQAASQQPPAQPGVQPQPGAQPAPAAAPPAPTPNQPPAAQTPQHASFLQRVQNGHMPSQGGTVAAAATPPGTQLPQNPTAGPDLFKQMLTNNFQRHGLLPAT